MNQDMYRENTLIIQFGSDKVFSIKKISKSDKKSTKFKVYEIETKKLSTIEITDIEREATTAELILKRRVLEVDPIDTSIQFSGKIHFHKASMVINADRPDHKNWSVEEAHWKTQLHLQMFNLVLNELNKLGYSIKQQKNIFTGPNSKYCRKGDLRLDVIVEYGSIKLDFYQNVNAPTRPDHGGRYEYDQHKLMPYLILLEMKRTRNRIKKLILENFDFSFDDDFSRKSFWDCVGPEGLTVYEWIQEDYKREGFTSEKLEASHGYNSSYNNESADKKRLIQGQIVWFYDRKGRLNFGKAYYRSNSMWWVVTGNYAHVIESSHSLFVEKPHDIRVKRNKDVRKNIISQVIFDAKNSGNYLLAEKLQKLFDREFDDIGLFITREQARNYFTHVGLKYEQITLKKIRKLQELLDFHLKASGVFRASLSCDKDIDFEFTDDGGMAHAAIKCSADYFKGRQAVDFEKNGFIGFAGWSDSQALKPILEAFVEWCDLMKQEVAA
ncbi:Uncharacterised protein [Acinetobacter baumannii]|uniref:hypothetical protein n=1 Tax=Acinetobacter baumannii TaxID=470 RepID=UPI000DE6E306|nr:hypothetical protein [Acinetobacter baumannii]SSM54506.1 Uncharacterised protein [Acinetobacter baumannii]SSM54517.1 Uncharacterised protein [Acinetobacter baumannii]SSN35542.1 Uncharacterised protein [Acinetobacter baumannii]